MKEQVRSTKKYGVFKKTAIALTVFLCLTPNTNAEDLTHYTLRNGIYYNNQTGQAEFRKSNIDHGIFTMDGKLAGYAWSERYISTDFNDLRNHTGIVINNYDEEERQRKLQEEKRNQQQYGTQTQKDDETQASFYIKKADEMIKNKAPSEEIIKVYNEGIKKNPNLVQSYMALADFYISKYNDLDKVIETYNRALPQAKYMSDKDNAKIRDILARDYYSKKNIGKSRQMFKEVLKYDPLNEEVKNLVKFLNTK